MWWRSGTGLSYFPLFSAWGSLRFFFFANLTFDRVKEQRRNKRIVFSCSIHPSSFILCSLTSDSVFPHRLKYAALTQSSGCPLSLSILGVPIVCFVLTRELRACLLAFLNVGSTQPWLCDTAPPQGSLGPGPGWGWGSVPGCNWGAGRGSARRYRVRPEFPVRMNSPSYL